MPPVGVAIGAALTAFSTATAGLLASTALSTGIGAFAFTAFKQIALGVALSALSRALAPSDTARKTGTKLQIAAGENQPQSFIFGRFITAGDLLYHGSYGKVNDTPRAYYTQVIQLADWPVRLRRVWADGVWQRYVPGSAADDEGLVFPGYRLNGKENMWIRIYDGTQTVADPYLLDRFGDDPDHPWQDDMIGLGMPYVVVTFLFHPKTFPNGRPELRFECEAFGWYDRRKDSTSGGAGRQRWNDWRTWRPTNNPVVMIDNVLRGVRDPVTEEYVWGGQDIGDIDLPAADWFAAMNECDQLVTLADDTTEKRFRAGMEVRLNEEPAAVIEELLRACNGQIADLGGLWTIRAGPPVVPVYAFTDDDIIVTSAESSDPFPGLDEAFNEVTATYPEPEHGYEPKDAPARVDEDAFAADGKRNVADLTFLAVPYRKQVQRLMRAGLKEARRFRRHVVVLPPEAQILAPLDEVTWTSERHGYAAKDFSVDLVEDLANGCVAVSLRERDPTDYDWNVDFELPDEVGVLVKPRRPPDTADFEVFPSSIKDPSGTARLPAILLTWPIKKNVNAIRYRVRLAATHAEVPVDLVAAAPEDTEDAGVLTIAGSPITISGQQLSYSIFTNVSEGRAKIHGGAIRPNTAYEVQAIYQPVTDRQWSEWKPVTTGNIKLLEDDLPDSIIDKVNDAETAAGAAADAAADAYALALKSKDAIVLGNDGASIRLASSAGTILLLGDHVIAPGTLSAGSITVQSFGYNIIPDDQLQSDSSWHSWIAGHADEWRVVPESPSDDVASIGEVRWIQANKIGTGNFTAADGPVFPVRPGMKLKWGGQIRRVGGSTMSASVRLYFYARRRDSAGALVEVVASAGAPSPATLTANPTSAALQSLSGTTVVPDNAYQAKVRFVVMRDTTDVTHVRFYAPSVIENVGASVLITPDGAFMTELQAVTAWITNAMIANATITDAKIGRLNVKRLRIQEFTWTKPVWYSDASMLSVVRDGWEEIATVTINRRSGSALKIEGAFGWVNAGSVSSNLIVRFRRGSTNLNQFEEERPGRDGGNAIHVWYDATTQTGGTTYRMQVFVPGGYDAGFTFKDVSLYLNEIPDEEVGVNTVDLTT